MQSMGVIVVLIAIILSIQTKEDSSWYVFDDIDERDEQFNKNSAFSAVRESKLGENVIPTEIKHLSHQHNLVLCDDVKDEKVCDGCMLIISTAFYYCSKCNFFLHKSCAESPRKIYIWSSQQQYPYGLIFYQIFLCDFCGYEFNSGFAYSIIRTDVSDTNCLRCALISDTITCGGHEHRLTAYRKYEGQCRGCGDKLSKGYACKDCNFLVDVDCLWLPDITRHKFDEHPLMLTYRDENVYSEYNYCDICEERRNPDHWFYHCVICNNSVHPKCAIGRYSFMKLGLNYTKEDHPHPLTCIQKVYDYSYKFHECGQPCLDVALECVENGCNYIVHWKCVRNRSTTLKRLN